MDVKTQAVPQAMTECLAVTGAGNVVPGDGVDVAHPPFRPDRGDRPLLGFQHEGKVGSFDVVRVNQDLTLDFAQADPVSEHHYAFAMDRDTFDVVFERVKSAGITYGDGPHSRTNMRGPGESMGSRGIADSVYFPDPSGHVIEIRSY